MDNKSITTGADKFHKDIRAIIEAGRKLAYAAVGQTTVATYWQIGCRIVEEEQDGKERAKYGSKLLKSLSSELTREYGSGFSKRNLEYARKVIFSLSRFSNCADASAQSNLVTSMYYRLSASFGCKGVVFERSVRADVERQNTRQECLNTVLWTSYGIHARRAYLARTSESER